MTRVGLFPFVQFEFAGRIGLDEGRYLVRPDPQGAERVLVVQLVGALPRPGRFAGRRARRAETPREPEPLEVTRVTAVQARELGDDAAAKAWLEPLRRDEDGRDEALAEGIGLLNMSLHAQSVAAMDPYVGELEPGRAVAIRIGYGSGEEVSAGRWRDAIEVPASRARRSRADALRPQERVAAVLAGRERLDACETLLVRARLDLDLERLREAALQLDGGLAALLVELDHDGDAEQAADLAALGERRAEIAELARAARTRALAPSEGERLEAALRLAERLLRRRRIRGS